MFASIGAKLAALGVVAAIIIGGWLYIGKLHAENAAQAVSISELQGVNAANAATIANMQADVRRYDAIEEATERTDSARASDVAAEHAAVNATPPVAISPVLTATLAALRAKP